MLSKIHYTYYRSVFFNDVIGLGSKHSFLLSSKHNLYHTLFLSLLPKCFCVHKCIATKLKLKIIGSHNKLCPFPKQKNPRFVALVIFFYYYLFDLINYLVDVVKLLSLYRAFITMG